MGGQCVRACLGDNGARIATNKKTVREQVLTYSLAGAGGARGCYFTQHGNGNTMPWIPLPFHTGGPITTSLPSLSPGPRGGRLSHRRPP